MSTEEIENIPFLELKKLYLDAGKELEKRCVKQICDTREKAVLLCQEIRNKKVEEMWAIYLDQGMNVLEYGMLFRGSVSTLHLHISTVFQNAFIFGASGIVLLHNHPSGDLTISDEDWRSCRALHCASMLFDVSIQDYIIVTKFDHISLCDQEKYARMKKKVIKDMQRWHNNVMF